MTLWWREEEDQKAMQMGPWHVVRAAEVLFLRGEGETPELRRRMILY